MFQIWNGGNGTADSTEGTEKYKINSSVILSEVPQGAQSKDPVELSMTSQ
jgi:hypothetical protein